MINFIKNLFNNKKDILDANALNNKTHIPKKKAVRHILSLTDGIKQIYDYKYQTNEEREEILSKIKEIKEAVLNEFKNDSLYFRFGDNVFLKKEFKSLYIQDCDF